MAQLSKIYYAKPSITTLEIQYASDAAANGWGEHCYAYIQRFEKSFRTYLGSQYAIATSSATGALHLGMAALGIGAGDEVILADANWIASVAPIVHLGATPVFVDILQDTWCLDPEKVEAAITPRTKAIVAVHLYGNLCDMEKLETIASKYNLYIIEDAAEAIGSRWSTCHAGTRGIFGVFSFHGTKTITTGEGGMFVTNDDTLHENVLTLNNHGRKPCETRQFWASTTGYKFKISNIQAAIGCAQVERIDELVARRREVYFAYRERLNGLDGITMNPVPQDKQYGYWMPTVVFSVESHVTQRRVLEAFKEKNVDGRSFFAPLSLQASFSPCPSNSNSHSIYTRAINLPSYHDIEEDDIKRICTIIQSFL